LMQLSEYTLKIDGKKSCNYLIFKNRMDFKILKPDLTISINTSFKDLADNLQYIFLQHPQPIQQDVFFVCENYVNLTVTRNAYVRNVATDYAVIAPQANQSPTPYSIGNQPIVKNLRADAIGGGTNYVYRPPNRINAEPNTLGTFGQMMESYTQPIDQFSVMSNVPANSKTLYFQFPLVEIGYIIFNNNDFDKIMNQ